MFSKWINAWKEDRAKKARKKKEKESLHEMGWEIRCDCGLLHNTDKAGRIFADSEHHWHIVCNCGKTSRFIVGAPVLIPDGESELPIKDRFYELRTFNGVRIRTEVEEVKPGDSEYPLHNKVVIFEHFNQETDEYIGKCIRKQYGQSEYECNYEYLIQAKYLDIEGNGLVKFYPEERLHADKYSAIWQIFKPAIPVNSEEGHW